MGFLRPVLPFALAAFFFSPSMTGETFADERGDSGGPIVTQEEDLITIEWPGGLAAELPPLLQQQLEFLRRLMEELRRRYAFLMDLLKSSSVQGSAPHFQFQQSVPLFSVAGVNEELNTTSVRKSEVELLAKERVQRERANELQKQSPQAGDVVRPRGLYAPTAARHSSIETGRALAVKGSR